MGGTFFQGIVLALAGFPGSLFHFLVNFSYCWSPPPPSRVVFCRGLGKDALWVPRHTTSGPLVGAGAFGLYCAPLATRWRPGSTTRDCLLENVSVSGGLWLSVIQPRANLGSRRSLFSSCIPTRTWSTSYWESHFPLIL